MNLSIERPQKAIVCIERLKKVLGLHFENCAVFEFDAKADKENDEVYA